MYPEWFAPRYSPPSILYDNRSRIRYLYVCPGVRRIYILNNTEEPVIALIKYWHFGLRHVTVVFQPGFSLLSICSPRFIGCFPSMAMGLGIYERNFGLIPVSHKCCYSGPSEEDYTGTQFFIVTTRSSPPTLFNLTAIKILSCLGIQPGREALMSTLQPLLPKALIRRMIWNIRLVNPLFETVRGNIRPCLHFDTSEL